MKNLITSALFILGILFVLQSSTIFVSAETCEDYFGPLAHDYFLCHTTYYPYFECVPNQWVCNGVINCQDGTDETLAACYGKKK
uniref:Uncharacterized protein n=1 Tax=Panagrolaimus davidi TaxID=227884 RepID=A0A914Q979_9BILA